jgi:hypothetical protein
MQGDTRIIPKDRPTTKVAYVFIEELIKSQVSFNPNPPKLPPRPFQIFTIDPHEEEGNTNFSGLHHKPWELLGDT